MAELALPAAARAVPLVTGPGVPVEGEVADLPGKSAAVPGI